MKILKVSLIALLAVFSFNTMADAQHRPHKRHHKKHHVVRHTIHHNHR